MKGFFVGIESGSSTQLLRYNKGVKVSDNLKIINQLEKLGINVDIGFIMFDPLCSKEEINENLVYIMNSTLRFNVSRFIKKLRLIPYTKYYNCTKNHISIDRYDEMSAEYIYNFKDKDVELLYNQIVLFEKKHLETEYKLQSKIRSNRFSDKTKSEYSDQLNKLRMENINFLRLLLCDNNEN